MAGQRRESELSERERVVVGRFELRQRFGSLKTVQMIDPRERVFLDAAERGDGATVKRCLEEAEPVNVNATNLLGRTALEIAVDNENVEIVQFLLEQPEIRVGNALLGAIREGVYGLVEMMINHGSITTDMLGDGWEAALEASEAAAAEYSPDISPILLAAHLNQFEIIQLLQSRGVTIRRPHSLSCKCGVCEAQRNSDSLFHSLRRIHTYRALASPAWISLTQSDPIHEAFALSRELERLSRMENEFKDAYLELAEQTKVFACDLLSQCRSTEEVIAVLNKDSETENEAELHGAKLSLARLKLAIKNKQKAFVAHPHCQQLLTSIWYEGFPGRRERGSMANVFIVALLIVAWPVLSLLYIVVPKSSIGRIVRSPFMKFLYYSTSFFCFLFLLTAATFEDYRSSSSTRASERGPAPTLIETLICLWVLGMVWSECKQLWEEGFTKYLKQWWNWLDFIMMSLYLCTFTLRGLAYGMLELGGAARLEGLGGAGWTGAAAMPRSEWVFDEPMLVAESLFAVANVFSFARIVYLFQTNPYLGPLQISLGCMLIDIAKFCFIFFLILSSFSIGLAQLYWYYEPASSPLCAEDAENPACFGSGAFSSISQSYTTLIWSLFSITNPRDTVVLPRHSLTQSVGQSLFIAYHVTSIIVLLNMLIAMMSHSFQIINDAADMEWKFHRTKLWMSYFDEGSSLPAPFNIICTPKSMCYAVQRLVNLVRWCFGRYQWRSRSKRATIRRPGYGRRQRLEETGLGREERGPEDAEPQPLTYHDIMKRLVSRYIHQTKKDMKMDGVNEDDLLEIKQDISSLRYELREDRVKDQQRSTREMDAVKHDIMRTLSLSSAVRSHSPHSPSRSPATSPHSSRHSPFHQRGPHPAPPQVTVTPWSPSPEQEKRSPDRAVVSPTSPLASPPPPDAASSSTEKGVSLERALAVLKEEILAGVRRELAERLGARPEGPSAGPSGGPAPPLAVAEDVGDRAPEEDVPLITNGRLYDTHLYTQC